MNVRGQDGDEKKNQRDACGAPCRGDHQTNRTGYLAKPGEENHRSRPWNPSRRHANEVFLHGREMRTRGEKKHDREAVAHIRGPRRESGCSRKAESTKDKDRGDEND